MRHRIYFLLVITLLVSCVSPSAPPRTTSTLSPTWTRIPTNTHTPIPTPTPTSEGIVACVGTTDLNLRSGPGIEYEVVGGVASGTCVVVIARDKYTNWGWIITDSSTGWVSLYYVTSERDLKNLPLYAEISKTPNVILPTPQPSKVPTIRKTSTPHPTATIRRTNTPHRTSTPTIPLCENTKNYNGKIVTCKLPYAYCSYHPEVKGDPTFCNDYPYPNHNFTMLVWGNDWSSLNGSCLFVHGTVTIFDGIPQIVVSTQEQISYCR